eukprot:1110205-Pyramimonas_sp.AAC.1
MAPLPPRHCRVVPGVRPRPRVDPPPRMSIGHECENHALTAEEHAKGFPWADKESDCVKWVGGPTGEDAPWHGVWA